MNHAIIFISVLNTEIVGLEGDYLTSVDSNELKEFIRSTIDSIEQGTQGNTPKYYVNGSIKFEIAVVSTKKVDGGFKLFVANATGKISNEAVSKISFEIKKESESKGGLPIA